MISPLAITLALAFWAPYNHGQPVCPQGVHVTYEASGPDIGTGWVDAVPNPSCAMHLRADLAGQTVPYQCMIVAHELGHAAMGLPDDPLGPPGIMNGPLSIPGSCYPPRKAPTLAQRPAKRSAAGPSKRRAKRTAYRSPN